MASSDSFETPRTFIASHRSDRTEFVTPRELSSYRSSAFHTARELDESGDGAASGVHSERLELERYRAAMPFATPGLPPSAAGMASDAPRQLASESSYVYTISRKAHDPDDDRRFGRHSDATSGTTPPASGHVAGAVASKAHATDQGPMPVLAAVVSKSSHGHSGAASEPAGASAPAPAHAFGYSVLRSTATAHPAGCGAGEVASGHMVGAGAADSRFGAAGGTSGGPLGDEAVEDIFSLARHGKASRVQQLLSMGVPADIRDEHGNTVLHIACQNGLRKVAKAALRMGCDINAVNTKGNTPLHFCFAYRFTDLGSYLQSKGASSTIRNRSGLLPEEGIA